MVKSTKMPSYPWFTELSVKFHEKIYFECLSVYIKIIVCNIHVSRVNNMYLTYNLHLSHTCEIYSKYMLHIQHVYFCVVYVYKLYLYV